MTRHCWATKKNGRKSLISNSDFRSSSFSDIDTCNFPTIDPTNSTTHVHPYPSAACVKSCLFDSNAKSRYNQVLSIYSGRAVLNELQILEAFLNFVLALRQAKGLIAHHKKVSIVRTIVAMEFCISKTKITHDSYEQMDVKALAKSSQTSKPSKVCHLQSGFYFKASKRTFAASKSY